MIGILPIREAMRMASAQGYDLVEVSPKSDPPVCRILDYGRFLYEEKARQQATKKKQHAVSVRQMRLTLKISEHDFETKVRKMREFLEAKDRVKVTVILRGREVVHKEQGIEMINRIQEALSDVSMLEKEPRLEGTTRLSWQVMLLPLKAGNKGKGKKKKRPQSSSAAAGKKAEQPKKDTAKGDQRVKKSIHEAADKT
ncbi:translation initiation factor IF-3, partial [candidate division WOR-3 bacterium]|nr:translation initiation factor IF-3 [candidate division WOR-3 bacterium]MBD3365284.1 translation initiation factor IF-3 [candidate division WOR-3 bacterium]